MQNYTLTFIETMLILFKGFKTKGVTMRDLILMAGVAAFLLGCTSKEQKVLMQSYEKEKSYHVSLQKTEKTQLYDGQVTKALLTATYLFTETVDKNDTRNEKFIVGVYVEEEDASSLDSAGYTLTLNGQVSQEIKPLERQDPLLKDISFQSDWNQFYLVTFPHTSSKSFYLIFESDVYGKGTLHFAKAAKYVFSGKVL